MNATITGGIVFGVQCLHAALNGLLCSRPCALFSHTLHRAIPFPVQLDGNCFALLLAAASVVAVAIAEAVVCIICSPGE